MLEFNLFQASIFVIMNTVICQYIGIIGSIWLVSTVSSAHCGKDECHSNSLATSKYDMVCRYYAQYKMLVLFCAFVAGMLHFNHLMFWTIFAPKVCVYL